MAAVEEAVEVAAKVAVVDKERKEMSLVQDTAEDSSTSVLQTHSHPN